MKPELKYFIYARKSSEGADRQILSIEGQLNELHKIAKRDDLIVADVYTESKSAHIPNNRPVYTEMIKNIQKGLAQGIIVWHTNRITRNPKESGEIQQLLQDGIISSIITPYRHFRTEDNALLFSIEASEANQYSRDLSVNVKRGLRQKYEMGQPPGIAHIGYLNTKSSIRGANTIIVDSERWHILRKGFELILSRVYTVTQVVDILNNQYGLRSRPSGTRGGKPLSKSGFYRILTSPFYYGVFYRKGIMYPGSYKPLITIHEYDQIQLLLRRKGVPRYQKHVFAFTGLIKCATCGSSITASEKRKLIKLNNEIRTYTFYHCSHRKKGAEDCPEKCFIPVNMLEEQIIAELNKYQVNPMFKEWALSFAKENSELEIEKYKKLVAEQVSFENRLHEELSNLIDLRISNSIGEDVFLQKKNEKENQLIRVQADKEQLTKHSGNWLEQLNECLNFTSNIVERFKNADIETKKQICHDFGWNWTLKDKILLISKHEWLEPFRKYQNAAERLLTRLEPQNTNRNKGLNIPSSYISHLVRGLLNEVRTILKKKNKPKPP